MHTINELLKEIELHDSTLNSLKMNIDGSLELDIDIDEVWNKSLRKEIKGIVFSSVFEITEFKMDRLNIIGSVETEEVSYYNKEFITHSDSATKNIVMVSIEFVAGGILSLVCEDTVGYLE